MEHFRIQFFSTNQLGEILDIGYAAEQSEVVHDFLWVFDAQHEATSQTINIDYKHRNTEEFKNKLGRFISKYKSALPQIQRLGSQFNKLNPDEWFFILPPVELTTAQKYEAENELNCLNGFRNEFSEDEVRLLFGNLMENYELVTFDLDKGKKIKIGENLKVNRVCRFCHEKIPNVSFSKEAHAISEALGNKILILNDECDGCNEFFDENIERDFIYYHDMARTIYGVKNKENNIPKLNGKDFKLFNSGEGNLSIAIIQSNPGNDGTEVPESVSFKTGNKLKIQNLYKALCKFALSVIDSKHLSYFEDTILWIRNQKEANALPKVAVLNSHAFFTRHPEIILYLRNNESTKLPYLVGEFRFTCYLYIFIVPFSSKDTNCFIDDQEYREFLTCFKHIGTKVGFSFIDFSQNIEREVSFKINFEKN
jgi:hypothetical protein